MFIRNCPFCEKEIHYKFECNYNNAIKNNAYCRSCSAKFRRGPVSKETKKKMSETRKGEGNSFFGRHHSEETKRQIGEKTKEINARNGNPFLGKKHTPETREKMSRSRSEGIANGRISNTNGYGKKSWYTSSKTNELIYCDSILEKFRMTQLDTDKTIIWWTKKHGIKIPYVINEEKHNFIPDFLITNIDGSQLIEEVKGHDLKSEIKQRALEEYCKTYNIKFRWIDQTVLEAQGYRKFIEENK